MSCLFTLLVGPLYAQTIFNFDEVPFVHFFLSLALFLGHGQQVIAKSVS